MSQQMSKQINELLLAVHVRIIWLRSEELGENMAVCTPLPEGLLWHLLALSSK